MTTQSKDRVTFRGETYTMIEASGGPLASPEFFGMRSVGTTTANHRGFNAVYVFVDGRMLLETFGLCEESGNYITINSVSATLSGGYGIYSGLQLPIPFSGTLCLGKGFDQERHFSRPYGAPLDSEVFGTIFELEVVGGVVAAEIDRSGEPRQTLKDRWSM